MSDIDQVVIRPSTTVVNYSVRAIERSKPVCYCNLNDAYLEHLVWVGNRIRRPIKDFSRSSLITEHYYYKVRL